MFVNINDKLPSCPRPNREFKINMATVHCRTQSGSNLLPKSECLPNISARDLQNFPPPPKYRINSMKSLFLSFQTGMNMLSKLTREK